MFHAIWVDQRQTGFQDALSVRVDVFTKEQGYSPDLETDENDDVSVHAVVYDGGKPIATGRLFLDEGFWHIGRVCVLADHRGKGYGDLVVRMLCERAFETDPQLDIILHSQLPAKGLYEKIGFIQQGDIFMEEGQSHVLMRLASSGFKKPCHVS